MSINSPILPFQALVFHVLEDKCLDYVALHNAYEIAILPLVFLQGKRLGSKIEAMPDIISSPLAKNAFIVVTPSHRSNDCYKVRSLGYEEDGTPNYHVFDDNNVKMEFTERHPGTTEDSDVEDSVDAEELYPSYDINEKTSPITTVAAEHLYAVTFSGPGGIASDLKAAYACQLSARIDESRSTLNLDCFEYKPQCVDIDGTGDEMPLPTYGDIKKFDDGFNLASRFTSGYDSGEDGDSGNDDDNAEIVEPREGKSFTKENIMQLSYQCVAGNFANSRVLRVRIPLNCVVGVRLIAREDGKYLNDIEDCDGEEGDVGAALIIELNRPLGRDAFAARKVHSRYHMENKFTLVDDWTPNKVASRSSRCYLFGNLSELKQTAALLSKISPKIENVLSSGTSESNSLNISAPLSYGASPSFTSTAISDKQKEEAIEKKKGYVMSVGDVEDLLINSSLVESRSEARNANPCLKKAILLGYITIDDETTLNTVIFQDSCVRCSSSLVCTMEDALFQPTYGGHDYCEGEDAAVKCASCYDRLGYECGNYITGLCRNRFEFNSGKFHNHCTECEDFGICIGDYREDHCSHCGDHYFAGNYGYPCPSCGNGKSKDLAKLSPPQLSAWDGEPINAHQVSEAGIARRAPMEQMMLRAATLGVGSSMGGAASSDEEMIEAVAETCRQM